jgi:uncharacterized protein (UPF0333 family)
MKKLIIGLIVLAVIGIGVYYLVDNKTSTYTNSPAASNPLVNTPMPTARSGY